MDNQIGVMGLVIMIDGVNARVDVLISPIIVTADEQINRHVYNVFICTLHFLFSASNPLPFNPVDDFSSRYSAISKDVCMLITRWKCSISHDSKAFFIIGTLHKFS